MEIKSPAVWGAVVFAVSAFLLTGMGWYKVHKNVAADPRYAALMGKEFTTTTDLVLMKFKDDRETICLYPFGSSSEVPDKKDLKEKFPFDYYGNTILGILPAQSVFKLVDAAEEGTKTLSSIHYRAIISKSGNPQFVGWRIDPTGIAEVVPFPEVPKFQSKYAHE